MEIMENLLRLSQIVFVDLVLAGDNAIVIGLVAAKFTPEYRRHVILYGVAAAVLMRIIFSVLVVQLLQVHGLLLVGGLLLLWVCWKLWHGLREEAQAAAQPMEQAAPTANPPLVAAIAQIVTADLSMSLDNVLAVAAVADGHIGLLVTGLVISVVFMTVAATLIADLLQRYLWIGYIGLVVILYVAGDMIFSGAKDLLITLSV